MGFGFPKAERDGLVASDPETFYLPGDRRPALPVGVRPPRPARRRGDAGAGHRRLADVHAADAPRPAGPAGADRSRVGPGRAAGVARRTPAAASVPPLRGRRPCRSAGATRCSTTCADIPRRSRRPRSRSATARSTAGGGDRGTVPLAHRLDSQRGTSGAGIAGQSPDSSYAPPLFGRSARTECGRPRSLRTSYES